MARSRIIEATLIDAMRAWPVGEKLTVRALAKAVSHPHLIVGKAVDGMRMAGMIAWDRLALSPSLMVANDQESQAKADDEAAGVRLAETVVESVSRPDAGRSASATSEIMDVTAGETAPFSNAAPVSGAAEQAGGGVATASPPAAIATPDDRAARVLAHLTGIADAGAPCPRNSEIAAACGMPLHHVVQAVDRLIDRKIVQRDVGAARKQRRFVIVASGRATGWPEPDKPMGTVDAPRTAIVARADEDAEIAARREAVESARAESVAQAVRREAEEAGRNRAAARSTGTVVAKKGQVSVPEHRVVDGSLQIAMLSDGPGSATAALRRAWPDDLDKLQRLARANGERPMPCLVRLIREAAKAAGIGKGSIEGDVMRSEWGL